MCRPPSNRNPRSEELAACRWRLDVQIQLLKPEIIIALGKIAFEQLNGRPLKQSLNKYFFDKVGWMHHTSGSHVSKLLVTYHPSYLLRSPDRGYKATLPHWTLIKEWVEENVQGSI